MSTETTSTAGACPHCGAEIPPANVLITYRTSDGDQKAFAECSECNDVVHPG